MIFDFGGFFAENFKITLIIPEVVQEMTKRNSAMCKNSLIVRMEKKTFIRHCFYYCLMLSILKIKKVNVIV